MTVIKRRTLINITVNLCNKFVVILLGFIIPRLLISKLGSEANGLISAVNNLFIYVNLLEGGIAVAAIQPLYRQIVLKDTNKINNILSAVSFSYKKIGYYVLVCVIALAAIYPFFLESTYSYITISAVILLQGVLIICDYFFQAKFRVLLQAEAKSYVITTFNTAFNLLSSLFKIILINCGYDVVVIQLGFTFVGLLKIVFFQFYIKKYYAYIDEKATPDMNAISKSKYALILNTAHILSSNVDIIVITLLLGLKSVSVYSIYFMIFSAGSMIIESIREGVQAGFGQLYSKSLEKFTLVYKGYEMLQIILSFFVYTMICILAIPFIKIYTSDIIDINYIIIGLPIVFTISEIINKLRENSTKVIIIAGKFKETMIAPFVEIIINIILSFILVWYFGIVGVVAATCIASLYRLIYYTYFANRYIMKENYMLLFFRWMLNLCTFILIMISTSFFPIQATTYIELIGYGIIYSVVLLFAFLIINLLIPGTLKKIRECMLYFYVK